MFQVIHRDPPHQGGDGKRRDEVEAYDTAYVACGREGRVRGAPERDIEVQLNRLQNAPESLVLVDV